MITAHSPAASWRPAVTAAWCPKLREKCRAINLGSVAQSASSISAERSLLPSFTKMTSNGPSGSTTGRRRARSWSITDSSLYIGTISESLGGILGEVIISSLGSDIIIDSCLAVQKSEATAKCDTAGKKNKDKQRQRSDPDQHRVARVRLVAKRNHVRACGDFDPDQAWRNHGWLHALPVYPCTPSGVVGSLE